MRELLDTFLPLRGRMERRGAYTEAAGRDVEASFSGMDGGREAGTGRRWGSRMKPTLLFLVHQRSQNECKKSSLKTPVRLNDA